MNDSQATDAGGSESGAPEGAVPNFLKIYLQDHFAGATGGSELAQKTADSAADTAFGPPLAELSRMIDEDRQTLLEVMEGLGVGTDKIKAAGAWIGEKAMRLKTGAHELSSPALNPLVEIETLVIGVTGKRALWLTLRALTPQIPALERVDVERLIGRADDQLEQLERHRLEAVQSAYEAETGS